MEIRPKTCAPYPGDLSLTHESTPVSQVRVRSCDDWLPAQPNDPNPSLPLRDLAHHHGHARDHRAKEAHLPAEGTGSTVPAATNNFRPATSPRKGEAHETIRLTMTKRSNGLDRRRAAGHRAPACLLPRKPQLFLPAPLFRPFRWVPLCSMVDFAF